MKKEIIRTPRGKGFGFLDSDATAIRRLMKELSLTEAQVAKTAGITQQHLNRFLNGKGKLSAGASDRVLSVVQAARLAKSTGDESLQAEGLDPDKKSSSDPGGQYAKLLQLQHLTGPPRDPAAYEAWKIEQVGLLSASQELSIAKTWIKHIEKQRDELRRELSMLRELNSRQGELISAQKEMARLYDGWVEHLKQQLRNAGITPANYFPPD